MSQPLLPKTMRAWQYTSTTGGIEKSLKLVNIPLPPVKPTHHLIKVQSCALNPVDYKPAEIAFISRLLIKKPAIPGIDIVGRIITPAAGSALKRGQLVFGYADPSPFAGRGLAEYVSAPSTCIAGVPEGVTAQDASTVAIAGVTAYQSIVPRVKPGSRVFINGGSGGTGIFGIQIAKAVGCYVVTTCSTANIELCKRLGADEVIDYRTQDIVPALKKLGDFDLVVDNVGGNREIFWKSHEYTRPHAPFVLIAFSPTLTDIVFVAKALLLPGVFGGAKRKFVGLQSKPRDEELIKIGAMMAQRKVETVVDSTWAFEDVKGAFVKLKTLRAKGKIVVTVDKSV